LDVVVPQIIFNKTGKSGNKGAPVMVWIYGGGFTFTDPSGNPAGLIKRSQERSGYNEGVIYVKMNYRVISVTASYESTGLTDFRVVHSVSYLGRKFEPMALPTLVCSIRDSL